MNDIIAQDELARKIIDFCTDRLRFIYISGNGGSGKTTFSKLLVDEILSQGLKVNYLDMDEFVLDTKMRKSAKKEWVDKNGINRISEYTTSFRESYYLAAPEVIVHSLRQGQNCFYKPKKKDSYIALNADFPFTIIEGVGTAFLQKNNNALSLFMICDEETEVSRRIQRSRDGEDQLNYTEVMKKARERNEQFIVNILPNIEKFDIEIESLQDYRLKIKKDYLGALE